MSTSGRPRSVIKAESVWRLILLTTATRIYPSVLVTEFPKSGGTWLCQMLSDVTGITYPRNRFPAIGRNIYHGHYMSEYSTSVTIVLWRDPRDILISLYYFMFFETEFVRSSYVEGLRSQAGFGDFDDIRSNMVAFIDLCFERPLSPRFTWNDFFDRWIAPDRKVIHTSYEHLRRAPGSELARLLGALSHEASSEAIARTVDAYSFARMSGRKPGVENTGSFLRKGIVGDWKNVFSSEATDRLAHWTGSRISRLEELMNTIPDAPIDDTPFDSVAAGD